MKTEQYLLTCGKQEVEASLEALLKPRQIIANSQAAQFQASRDLNIVLRSLLKQFTSPQSQMRIKELIMATLVRSFTRVTENQSGKPLMVLAVRADTL